MPHTKFASIERFANVFRDQQRYTPPRSMEYGAKIKLHGTNAAIRIQSDGTVVAQGRNRDLFIHSDQFAFAHFVAENEDDWRKFREDWLAEYAYSFFPEEEIDTSLMDVVVHGEWAGPGVQRNDAVTKLDEKYFFIFGVQHDDHVMTDPDLIEHFIPDLWKVLVLPWFEGADATINFGNTEGCVAFSERVTEMVDKIGERDPFIYDHFVVDGPGEGLVFMPKKWVTRDVFSEYTFKVKTDAHSVQKGPKASVKVAVPTGVTAFAEMFVTPARCEQAVQEACGGEVLAEKTGDFLKWIGQDVHKESAAELEDSGFEWKQVQKAVTAEALKWWKPLLQAVPV